MATEIFCNYCKKQAHLVTGKEIYPHRQDLHSKRFWTCSTCDAYVGCHPGTTTPLGRLADATLRMWKSRAHSAFDPIWKNGSMKRSQAYKWLSEKLDIPPEKCHIGMFDVDLCKRTVKLCWNLKI